MSIIMKLRSSVFREHISFLILMLNLVIVALVAEVVGHGSDQGTAYSNDDGGFSKDDTTDFGSGNIFGAHRAPSWTVDEIAEDEAFPTPSEFYKRYIGRYRPVVLRGAAKQSRAYHLWTEEYLKDTYGDLTMKLEPRKEGSLRFPVGERGLGRDTLRHFIDTYQTIDGLVISLVPEAMEEDISFPPFLTCGSVGHSVQEADIYFSAKGGNSPLHRDPFSTVQCLFNGTKQWLVVDPTQKEQLYMVDEARYEFGGDSAINVDNLDYDAHPNVTDLQYARVILNRGDCIYMPCGYTHQVRTKGYMNVAVSIWFSHFLPLDEHGCDHVTNAFQPMSECPVLWRYSGYGVLPQGHLDLHMLRTVMKSTADRFGKIWLAEYAKRFIQGVRNEEKLLQKHRQQFIEYLDPMGTGYITVEALDSLSLEEMKEVILLIDPPEMSNKPSFEYHLINQDDIWMILRWLVEREPGKAFSWRDFIHEYTTTLAGSAQVAREILTILDPDASDEISAEMVRARGSRALANFTPGFKHDPTIEHLWYKQFVACNIFPKFGVTHFNDPRDFESPGEHWVTPEAEACSGYRYVDTSVNNDHRHIDQCTSRGSQATVDKCDSEIDNQKEKDFETKNE